MAQSLARRTGFVCHSCQFAQVSKSLSRPLSSIAIDAARTRSRRPTKTSQPSRIAARTVATVIESAKAPPSRPSKLTNRSTFSYPSFHVSDPPAVLTSIRQDVKRTANGTTIPAEADLLELLERIYQFSNIIIFGQPDTPEAPQSTQSRQDASSSVLEDLDESSTTQKYTAASRSGPLPLSFRTKAAETLCELAYHLIRAPTVPLTPEVLTIYVRTQCLLGRPEYLPEIFHLYANKPIATQSGTSVTYKNPTPWKPRYAIPHDLSSAALDAAIRKKDLPLAIAMIETTVSKQAYRYNRIIKKASLPIVAASTTPIIAYAGATWVSEWQNVWDVETAKWTALAGAAAYIGTLGMIGFIAVVTWNDHHDRVTWYPGTGLTERWIKEDERAYFDRVALAWGFQEKWRRGEEQGEEWESLREVCGLRSMVLDKTDHMEGMQ